MIELSGINLIYPNGVEALIDINMFIGKGEFAFIVGPTSSGKSSLLRLLYRDIIPQTGEIFIDNQNVLKLKRGQVPYLRRRIGVVFQDFKLLSKKTVYENVAYALEVIGAPKLEITHNVNHALDLVDLSDKKNSFPRELSGGEHQRTSIARALVNHPLVLLADEPTGNLDPQASVDIIKLLDQINSRGTTILVATHDKHIVDLMKKRVITLSEGRVVSDQEKGMYHFNEKEQKVN